MEINRPIYRKVNLYWFILSFNNRKSSLAIQIEMLFRKRNRIYNTIIKLKQINVSDNIQKPKKIWVSSFITVSNSSCGKVMSLHLSVILFTGVVCLDAPLGRHLPMQIPPPHGQTPSPPRWPLQRMVHNLLECILVTARNKVGARLYFHKCL